MYLRCFGSIDAKRDGRGTDGGALSGGNDLGIIQIPERTKACPNADRTKAFYFGVQSDFLGLQFAGAIGWSLFLLTEQSNDLARPAALSAKPAIYGSGVDYVFVNRHPALFAHLLVLRGSGTAYGQQNVWLMHAGLYFCPISFIDK